MYVCSVVCGMFSLSVTIMIINVVIIRNACKILLHFSTYATLNFFSALNFTIHLYFLIFYFYYESLSCKSSSDIHTYTRTYICLCVCKCTLVEWLCNG